MIKRKENSFYLQNLGNTLFQRKINVHKNWLRDHSSWAPWRIGMKIERILKFFFWISLHQGTLSLLCFRIQGYMLSLMNEVDPCVASAMGFVWDAKTNFSNSKPIVISTVNLPNLYPQKWEIPITNTHHYKTHHLCKIHHHLTSTK